MRVHPTRVLGVLYLLLLAGLTTARAADIRVITVNDHLLAFYDGRPAQSTVKPGVQNWADFGAMNVGVATYAIHRGDRALVYDSFPGTAQARWVRDYLEKAGIRHFTLVNSHWHLDHVGGNAVYADVDRIATERTCQRLKERQAAIETGTEWGAPAIKPLVMPTIGIRTDTEYFVADIRVELRPVHIHSEDGLVLYLPDDQLLLAGDTLEDTVTFIVEPEKIPSQYRNLGAMKSWRIERIYPNHGNPEVIAAGGYRTTLIDATRNYLRKMVERAHDPDYLKGSLDSYVHDSVDNGWVSVWWAYSEAHAANLGVVAKAYRKRPLPDFHE